MENTPVTLIIKAPNQQFEDQTVRCELSWTIKKLKGLLSEVYPSNPKTEEQRLIYSGQLLNDRIVLKDILRHYEGQEQDTHTVHLVLQPKPMSPLRDGLRQRNVSRVNHEVEVDDERRYHNVIEEQNMDISLTYHEWLTQMYRNYYNAYRNFENESNDRPQNGRIGGLPPYPVNYFPSAQMYSSPLMGHQNFNNLQQQPPPPPPQSENPPEPEAPQQALQEQPHLPQRFHNIDQEDQDNRDWLDMFYALSRLMVLLALVYFYSSPMRCLIVIFFSILYYGYHVGYFRQLNQEPNNNELPNHPEQPAAAAVAAADDNDEEYEEGEPVGNDVVQGSDDDSDENDTNGQSFIALVQTFIMSFFASLIPETPAL